MNNATTPATPTPSFAAASGIEVMVCEDIAARQRLGIAKYGTTVMSNSAGLLEWMQHAYEECLDQAVYLRRAMHQIDQSARCAACPPPGTEYLPGDWAQMRRSSPSNSEDWTPSIRPVDERAEVWAKRFVLGAIACALIVISAALTVAARG
jgi:hypothetical protein